MNKQTINTWGLYWRRLLPFYGLAFVAAWLVRDHVFFWDTIQLGSKHAHWYYDHNFQYLLLPESIDSGHPPIFGMYLALLWKLFGQSLAISHFAILPFTVLSIHCLYKIGYYFLGQKHTIWLLFFLMLDPTFAAQNLLVSPDAVLFAFFLLGIVAILYQQKWVLGLAAVGLVLISLRGMMVVVLLFLTQVYVEYLSRKEVSFLSLLQQALLFVPSGLIAFAFLWYHYQQTGWIGYHADSPWAASFERVDFKGLVWNVATYGWRILDFGRVFIVLPLLGISTLGFYKKVQLTTKFRMLLFLLLTSIVILSPTLLIYKGLLGHRYLLPIYFLLTLTFLYVVIEFDFVIKKGVILWVALLGLASGNCWIYPKTISQGWDASLAHLPYYKLRENMLHFIETEAIPLDSIGTVFPEIGAQRYKSLNRVGEGFVRLDLSENQFVYYATIMNDFSDTDLKTLANEWQIHKKYANLGLEVILYRRKLENNDKKTSQKLHSER